MYIIIHTSIYRLFILSLSLYIINLYYNSLKYYFFIHSFIISHNTFSILLISISSTLSQQSILFHSQSPFTIETTIGYKMKAKPEERDNLIEDSPMRWPWVGRDHKTPTRRFWLTWVMKWWISIWWALTWLYRVKDLLVGSSIQWALGLKNSSAFVYHVLPHCKICPPRAAPLLDFERESHFIYQEKK